MCDSRQTAVTTKRPRWKLLYAIPLLSAAALIPLQSPALPHLLKLVLRFGIASLAVVAVAWWIRANRAALDLTEWCACASETVTLRVIRSRPMTVGEYRRHRPHMASRVCPSSPARPATRPVWPGLTKVDS